MRTITRAVNVTGLRSVLVSGLRMADDQLKGSAGAIHQPKAATNITGSSLPTAANIAHAEASLPALFIHTQTSHVERFVATLETKEYVRGQTARTGSGSGSGGGTGILSSGDDWVLVRLPVADGPDSALASKWSIERILSDFASFDGLLRNTQRISLCTRRYDSFDQLITGWSKTDPLVSSFAKELPPAPAPSSQSQTDPGALAVAAGGTVCSCCGTVRPPPASMSAAQRAVSFRINAYPQQDDAATQATALCKRNVSRHSFHSFHCTCTYHHRHCHCHCHCDCHHNRLMCRRVKHRRMCCV